MRYIARPASLSATILALLAVPAVAATAAPGNALSKFRQEPRAAHVVMNPASASSVPSPSSSTFLYDVSCPSKSDCFAVGNYQNSSGAYINEVLRFNGKKWSVTQKVPQPGGKTASGMNELYSIACTSSSDCWAVGRTSSGAGGNLNQALHWNGKRWSSAKVPQPGGKGSSALQGLNGVACASGSDCWAVGFALISGSDQNELFHFNGTKWSSAKAPQPGGITHSNVLYGVSCASTHACWAVGYFSTSNGSENQALRLRGKKWSSVQVPQPAGTGSGDQNELFDVSCPSTSACLAGGIDGTGIFTGAAQALRWNGKKWSKTTPKQQGIGGAFDGVACTSRSSCWAVGAYDVIVPPGFPSFFNLGERFNGHTWKLHSMPQPGLHTPFAGSGMNSVACPSSSDCWAVGSYKNSSGDANEVLHWNGKKWSKK